MLATNTYSHLSNSTNTQKISYDKTSSSSVEDYTFTFIENKIKRVRIDQLWFWNKEWLDGEKEVDELLQKRDFIEADNLDSLFD